MSEEGYSTPERFDPHYLIDEYLPEDATIQSRTVLAAAIRNPGWTKRDISGFVDVSETTVMNALAAWARGTIDQRHSSNSVYRPADGISDVHDLTDKQRAVVEFYARYPNVHDDEHDWSRADVVNYIARTVNVEMVDTYTYRVLDEHEELVRTRRAQLRDEGVLEDLPDVPQKPEPVPETVRACLVEQIGEDSLPRENRDEGLASGEKKWAIPYRRNDLKAIDESELPHVSDDPEAKQARTSPPVDPNLRSKRGVINEIEDINEVGPLERLYGAEHNGPNRDDVLEAVNDRIRVLEEGEEAEPEDDGPGEAPAPDDDDDHFEIERGNSKFSGPAIGDDPAPQTITEAPAWQGDDEAESPVLAYAARMEPTADGVIEAGAELETRGDAEPEHAESLIGVKRDEWAEEARRERERAAEATAELRELRGAFDALAERIDRRVEQARREHQHHESEASAARFAALEAVEHDLRAVRPDGGDDSAAN